MHEFVSFGPVEEDARKQIDRCLDAGGEEARGVLCADHHKGYSMPIGGVLASQSVVMPAGVGYDIACGNCAVRTNLNASALDVKNVMDEIWSTISFGVGRQNDEPIRDAAVFAAIAHSPVPQQRALLPLARSQLGTVGSGNHYVCSKIALTVASGSASTSDRGASATRRHPGSSRWRPAESGATMSTTAWTHLHRRFSWGRRWPTTTSPP